MHSPRMSRRRVAAAVVGAGLTAALLAGCSSGGAGSSSDGGNLKSFTFLGINENTTIPSVLTELSTNECKAENTALPLKITKQAQSTLDQQLQLLGGQNALPAAFVSANSPKLTYQLYTSKNIVDLATTPIADDIVPLAASGVKALYQGKTVVLPTELNIEGIWYNKSLLEKAGVAVPTTWDELTAAFKTLKAKGTQPIVAAGKGGDGWGVTRWIGAYLYRELGPDALQDVADGKAKLTDPKYVKAADAVAALGKAGYFGSPASVDYATALNSFLTGKAAFYYMGSWAVSAYNDPKQNKIGTDDIGFMKFPTVSGGAGSADQTPTNVGTDIAFSATAYKNPKVKAWAKCIAANYGAAALKSATQVTGLKVNGDVTVPALTKLVQDQIAGTTSSVQWFEALFGTAATTASQNSGGLIGSGQLNGSGFMSTVSAKLTQ